MRFLVIFLFLFILFPLSTLHAQTLSVDDCDAGTYECDCYHSPSSTVCASCTGIEDCQEACLFLSNVKPYVIGFSVSCMVDEVLTTIYQGGINDELPFTEESDDTADVLEEEKKDAIIPNLNVDIPPGVEFDAPTQVGDKISSNFLGVYLTAVYQFVLIAASLLAVVMIMIGGLQYMLARGNKGSIDSAIKRMRNAVVGLVLLFGTYSIAALIDPNTIRFSDLELAYIDPEEYIDNSGDILGDIELGDIPAEVLCNSSYSVTEIATSLIGHVAYRMGGKGQGPIYQYETKISPTGRAYKEYCPSGNICLDCSGFAGYIATCAGIESAGESGGTNGIFTSESSEEVKTCTSDGIINDIALNPGDLIGWSTALTSEQSYGHVFVYIGNGRVIDSSGGGREPGKAVSTKSISWVCNSYGEHLYVRRR